MIFVALTGLLIGSVGGSVIGNGIKVNDENKLRVDFKKGWAESNRYGLLSELLVTAAFCALSGAGEVVNEAFDDTKKELYERKDEIAGKVADTRLEKEKSSILKTYSRIYNAQDPNNEINSISEEQGIDKFKLYGIKSLEEGDICNIIDEKKEDLKSLENLTLAYSFNHAMNFDDLERIQRSYNYAEEEYNKINR